MPRIELDEAQRRLPELIAQTLPGEEIEILREGRVVARLVPVPEKRSGARAGSARGSILYIAPDFDAPLDDFQDTTG